MDHHRLVGSEVIGHDRSETPRRFRRFLEKFVNLHRVGERELRSGFGQFVCEVMERDRFQLGDGKDWVTDEGEAVVA
jgi:hypothetical protein